jgi:hypothetical protein
MCSRSTKKADSYADAVVIFCVLSGGGLKEPHILLVKQFRPPIEAYAIEMPAGLIDPGETPETVRLLPPPVLCGVCVCVHVCVCMCVCVYVCVCVCVILIDRKKTNVGLHRGLHREGVGSDCVHAVYGNVGSHATLSLSLVCRGACCSCAHRLRCGSLRRSVGTWEQLRQSHLHCAFLRDCRTKRRRLCASTLTSTVRARAWYCGCCRVV